MDYYQQLGVSRNCDRDTLHRAFRELSKKFHPDRFPERERPTAETRYQQIVIAFNKLKDPRQRQAYDKTLDRPVVIQDPGKQDPRSMADRLFKVGVGKLDSGDYEGAVDALNRAVHYHEDAEYYYYKGKAESQVNRLHKESVASLQKAIAKNPRNPKYYVELANLFSGYGLQTRAKTVLEKAKQLFPNNREVMEMVQGVMPTREKKGGVLGGLFGKKKGD